jgi:hypothetical protein
MSTFGIRDVQGYPLAQNDNERCTVAMGAAGDDSRRCERLALPLHRTHLVDGMYYLPTNTDEINDALAVGSQSEEKP